MTIKLLFYLALAVSATALLAQAAATGSSAPMSQRTTTTPPTTTTPRANSTDQDDESEPATSTTDSLGVNSDEAGGDAELGGIEPKSISRESPEVNTLSESEGAGSERDKAKLSIENGGGGGGGQTTVVHRLNMTEIDETYLRSTKGEREIVESWQKMNKKLKRGISQLIGSVVPWALNMTQEAKISSNCSGAMLKWVLSMNQLKSWALRMLDASGKPIAGLLEGSLTMFGNYRECLKVRAPDDDEIEFAGEFKEYFRGKYCIIQAKPWLPEKDRFYNLNAKLKSLYEADETTGGGGDEDAGDSVPWYEKTVFDELSEWLLAFNFVNIRMDLCVPSLCTREDLQKVINYLLKGIDLKVRVARCELEAGASGSPMGDSLIESNPHELPDSVASVQDPVAAARARASSRHSQLGWILVPLLAVCAVVLCTLLSVAPGLTGSGSGSDKSSGVSKLRRTIGSLSLKRSISSHLNVDYDQLADDKPLALYGVRFLLIIWVLLVESAINLKFEYLRELLLLKELIFFWPMQFIINSTLQFDSLILLTAFTMGYKNCLNESGGPSQSGRSLFRFVLDKYVRLMPSIMVLVAGVILMPHAYRGPVWNDYVQTQSRVCQSNGWINVAFLQNYLPYKEICLPQTWLFSVELQLVILMAPIVYFLNKRYSRAAAAAASGGSGANKKQHHQNNNHQSSSNISSSATPIGPFYWLSSLPGLTLLGCIVFSLLISFYNVYANQLPPSWFYTMADPDSKADYFSAHLMRLWTHVSVFGMGLLAGIECRRVARDVMRARRLPVGGATSGGFAASNLASQLGDLRLSSGANGVLSSSSSLKQQQQRGHSSSASSLTTAINHLGDLSAGDVSAASTGSGDLHGSTASINHPQNHHHQHGHQQHQQQHGSRDHMSNLASESGRSDDVNIIVADSLSTGADGLGKKEKARWAIRNAFVLLLVLGTMSAIIFSTHDWSLKDLPEPMVAGLYDAVSRFLWSMAMIWILYMVSVPNRTDGQLSCLARSLGHPMLVSLGKLSFLIYLLHPFVHSTVLAIQEQPIYSSWLMLFHILIGNITITVILALLISLFVEMPCRNLFRRCETSLLLAHHQEGSLSAMTSSSG